MNYLIGVLLSMSLLLGAYSETGAGALPEFEKLRTRFADAYSTGELEALGRMFAASAELHLSNVPFRLQGQEAIRNELSDWISTFPTRKLTFHQPAIRLYGDTAIDSGYLRLQLVDGSGQSSAIYGRYTMVLLKLGREWLIIDLHISALPASP